MSINRIDRINQIVSQDKKSTKPEVDALQVASFSRYLLGASQIKISKHANQRLQTQNIKLDENTVLKLEEAVSKAEEKGLKNDVLILNGDIAYVVNIKNKVVVTVKDMNNLKENIFTNIEGVLMI